MAIKLSIITINLNNAEGLQRTIESVVTQTFDNFEYIIIDGASTDNSLDVICEYSDHITYWVSEPDKGIYNAMNKGISMAKGEYVQFLNSGDWLVDNDVLKKVFDLSFDADIVYGDIYSDLGNGNIIPDVYPEIITAFRLFTTTICHQSIFHKKTLFDKYNYNEANKVVSDWEFLIRSIIIDNCSVFKVNYFIVCLDSINSTDWGNLIAVEREKIIKRYFPMRIINDYTYFQSIINNSYYKSFDIINQHPKLRKIINICTGLLSKIFRINK